MKQVRKPRWLLYLILAGLIAFGMSFLSRVDNSTTVIDEFTEYEAKNSVKEFLYENLKDPGSYEPVAWGKLDSAGGHFRINHRYRAKNGFGGYNVETKTFIFGKNRRVLTAY